MKRQTQVTQKHFMHSLTTWIEGLTRMMSSTDWNMSGSLTVPQLLILIFGNGSITSTQKVSAATRY